jgi:hypothetical protein
MIKKLFFSLALTLTVFTGISFAAHPLITDDTGTQGKGKAQLELNSEFNSDKDNGVKTTGGEVAAALSYGLADNVDLVLGMPYVWGKVKEDGVVVYNEKGLSDMSLELKWRFYEADNGWSFALKPGVSLPTGDDAKGLGAGRAAYGIAFITTKELKPWAFHFNLGYVYSDNKVDERKDIWHVSAAAEVEVVKDLKIVGNIGMQRNPDKALNTNPAFILGGLIYSLAENMDVDFGVKAGLNKPETDLTFLAGITLRF